VFYSDRPMRDGVGVELIQIITRPFIGAALCVSRRPSVCPSDGQTDGRRQCSRNRNLVDGKHSA